MTLRSNARKLKRYHSDADYRFMLNAADMARYHRRRETASGRREVMLARGCVDGPMHVLISWHAAARVFRDGRPRCDGPICWFAQGSMT